MIPKRTKRKLTKLASIPATKSHYPSRPPSFGGAAGAPATTATSIISDIESASFELEGWRRDKPLDRATATLMGRERII